MPTKTCPVCKISIKAASKPILKIKYSTHQSSKVHIKQKVLSVAKTLDKNYRFKVGHDRLYHKESKTITLSETILDYPVRTLKDTIRRELELALTQE